MCSFKSLNIKTSILYKINRLFYKLRYISSLYWGKLLKDKHAFHLSIFKSKTMFLNERVYNKLKNVNQLRLFSESDKP